MKRALVLLIAISLGACTPKLSKAFSPNKPAAFWVITGAGMLMTMTGFIVYAHGHSECVHADIPRGQDCPHDDATTPLGLSFGLIGFAAMMTGVFVFAF